jgi:diaminopimelate epimerase
MVGDPMKLFLMNGLGNTIALLDARNRPADLTEGRVQALARATNFDQLMVLEPPRDSLADLFTAIWNADGSTVAACGNGARCVAWHVMEETGTPGLVMQTEAGFLAASRAGPMAISIDMGEPGLDWTQIPLSERMDTIRIELQVGPQDAPVLWGPGAVSMGNPHCVFFVDNAETAPVEKIGPMIEWHPLFPERCNVGFAQILAPDRIRLRVWERGVGLTKACGTGACAALVAAVRRRLCDRRAVLALDGGELVIEWRNADNHVIMTGPVEFDGVWDG